MAKRALAIRHVAFEDLGTLGALLEARGFEVEYLEIAPGVPLDAAEASDLLVVLGGPIGVYETEAYPFLDDEMRVLERRLAANRPILGICLGAQLLARALGARVFAGGHKEIGWSGLKLTDAGLKSCLAPLAASDTPVLHWHGDTFDLPEGATLLASTELYANQAFTWGKSALGLQFHVEVSADSLEHWYVGSAVEIAQAKLHVPALRRDSQRFCERLAPVSRACFERWLALVGFD